MPLVLDFPDISEFVFHKKHIQSMLSAGETPRKKKSFDINNKSKWTLQFEHFPK
jgi:hypothetical protein